MRRAAVVVGFLLTTMMPGQARAAPAAISMLPTSANEIADLSQPGLRCAPPTFPGIGYTGPCVLAWTIAIDPPPTTPVDVTVAFSFGTASAPDVASLPPPTTYTFPSSACVCVTIADDAVSEADETVIATITAVSSGTVVQPSAPGVILDNELPTAAPVVTITATGQSFVTVGWTAVQSLRGVTTGYTVAAIDNVTDKFVGTQRVRADTVATSFSGLAAGHAVDVYVLPETTDGYGALSAPVAGTPNAGGPAPAKPGAPLITSKTAGDKWIGVTWSPPAGDGGAPLTTYSVVATDSVTGALAGWRNFAADDRAGSLALPNAVKYNVSVIAWNAVGATASPAVGIKPGAIGPDPQSAAAVPFVWQTSKLGEMVVRWGPATERGFALTGYSVVVSEHVNGRPVHLVEWQNVGRPARTALFDGLTLCYYDVTVIPFDANGFGDAMTISVVVPPPVVGGFVACQNPPD